MNQGKLKFLIINFSFPPYPGTGGRRWVKISKELLKRGMIVNVIGAFHYTSYESPWSDELSKLKINYYAAYPYVKPFGWMHRLINKALKLFTRLNYNDLSLLYFSSFKNTIKRLINNNQFDVVVISLPPYELSGLVPYLKKMTKNSLLVTDIRDTHLFYLKTLSKKKIKVNEEKYLKNISSSDMIISVNDYFTNYYSKRFPKLKCETLYNFYDEDDLKTNNEIFKYVPHSDECRIIYTGNLIPECRIYVNAFIDALVFVREHNPNLFKKIKINIYGNVDSEIQKRIDYLAISDNFKFFGHISSTDAQGFIVQSHCCLIFPADFYAAYSLETKFFEYTYHRKPIITFPEKGLCSEIITMNNLGIALPIDNPGKKFLQFLLQIHSDNFPYNYNFNIESYSLKAITSTLLNLIQIQHEKK